MGSRQSNNKAGNVRKPITVTLGRVRITIFAAKKQDVLLIMSVCSLSYSACNAHAPHYIVICDRPVWLNYIFPHYLTHGMIFEKEKLLNTKCVFRFSLHILSEIFFISGKNQGDNIINVHRFTCEVPSILVRD